MKIEEYPCVKMKREAQERIHAETKHLAPKDQLARHRQSFEELKRRREELINKAKAKKTA
jgi:hypothetical protein